MNMNRIPAVSCRCETDRTADRQAAQASGEEGPR